MPPSDEGLRLRRVEDSLRGTSRLAGTGGYNAQSLHNPYFLLRKRVQVVDKLVDLFIGCIDLALVAFSLRLSWLKYCDFG
jgi:hypothetical protein